MLNTTVGQITDKGLKRQANEDNLLALPGRGLFLVADGVGGRRGGQTASRTVVEVFERVFSQPQPQSSPEAEMEELRALVGNTVDLCNQKIFTEAEQNADLEGMATTLALAAVRGNRAIIAHVGDSRVYRCDAQGLIQLTEDHSEVNEAVRAGILTPQQAENHPRRNVISRAIGADSEVEAEIIEIEVDESTTLFLCSDGITRHIRDDQLERLLRSGSHPQAICETMKQLCYNEGAEDNLTAIIVQFGAEADTDEQTRPMRSMRASAATGGSAGGTRAAAVGNTGGEERPKKVIEIDLSGGAAGVSGADPDASPASEPGEPPPYANPVDFAETGTGAPPPADSAALRKEQRSQKQKIAGSAMENARGQKVEMSKLMRLSVLIVTLLAGFVLGGLFGGPLSHIVNNGAGSTETTQPRVLRYSPSDPNVADAYGMMIAGRNDESRRRLNEILVSNQNNAEAHYCLGRLDFTEKRYEEAVNHFKQAVGINPELDEAWVFIAAAYLNIGQARNASDSLQKLLTPTASPSPSPSATVTPASTAKPVG